MIWPLAASLYILIGGICLFGITRANSGSTAAAPFGPAVSFALVCGSIALWPVLLALAINEAADDKRNDPR